MIATVADIIDVMETIAPSRLSEKWDNVGLQVGKANWPVKRLRVALDPLTDIVNEACRDNIDLLITHHPLIFKPLTRIDFETPVGRTIRMAAKQRLAIFAAHTNLDLYGGRSIRPARRGTVQLGRGPGAHYERDPERKFARGG